MPNDLDIPMPHMTPAEASYRARRPRARMDSDTRRLALLAGGIAAVLLLLVGVWALAGRHHGGAVPVVQADATPWRTKPDAQPAQADDPANDTTAGAIDSLAPPPETPAPQTLKTEADKLNAAAATAPAAAASASAAAPAVAPASLPAASAASPVPVPAMVSRSPVAPAPAVAAGSALVQLGSLDSEQLAATEWQRLQRKMPDLLAARQPAVARSERDGKTFYSLRVGGFASIAAATAFCGQVRAKGGVCTLARS